MRRARSFSTSCGVKEGRSNRERSFLRQMSGRAAATTSLIERMRADNQSQGSHPEKEEANKSITTLDVRPSMSDLLGQQRHLLKVLAEALISLSSVNFEITQKAKLKHRSSSQKSHQKQVVEDEQKEAVGCQWLELLPENGKVEDRKQPRQPIDICEVQENQEESEQSLTSKAEHQTLEPLDTPMAVANSTAVASSQGSTIQVVLVKAYSYPFLSEPKCHARRRQRRFSIPPNVMLSSSLSSGCSSKSAAADLLPVVRDESDMTDEIDASHWGETMDHHSNLTADAIDLAEFARCKEESV